MMSKKMVKIICINMAGLMILSACAVLLQVFAADEAAVISGTVIPDTGASDMDYIIPAGIAVAAVLAVILCLVLPKMRKKDTEE